MQSKWSKMGPLLVPLLGNWASGWLDVRILSRDASSKPWWWSAVSSAGIRVAVVSWAADGADIIFPGEWMGSLLMLLKRTAQRQGWLSGKSRPSVTEASGPGLEVLQNVSESWHHSRAHSSGLNQSHYRWSLYCRFTKFILMWTLKQWLLIHTSSLMMIVR